MSVRRYLSAATGLAAAAAGALVFASPAIAATPTINDIDGDGRVDVVVVDTHNEFVGETETEAEHYISRVVVYYGSGQVQKFSREELGLASGDSFHASVAVANLNADGFADLVISGHDHVVLANGSSSGVSKVGVQDLSVRGAGDVVVVAKPTPLVVVGRHSEDVSGMADAGVLTAFPVDASGKAGAGVDITQDSAGIPGTAEAGDFFGMKLAADDSTLVVASTGEDIGGVKNTGMVAILHRTGTTSFSGPGFSQNSAGVAGSNAAYDNFGATLAIEDGYVAVGINKTINGRTNAGAVQLFTYTSTSVKPGRGFNQNSSGIPGTAEASDQFGASLAFTRPCAGQRAIAVGAAGEDSFEGRVTMVNLSSTASCKTKTFGPTDINYGSGKYFDVATSLRSSAASSATDALLTVRGGQIWESKYPYTSAVKKWGSSSLEGLDDIAAPMAS